MSDRELLEKAAKAADMWVDKFTLDDDDQPIYIEGNGFYLAWRSGWWNPLTDDGDALRLAVKLGLVVVVLPEIKYTGIYLPAEHIGGKYDITEFHDKDPYAATRRAIVRAAAAIGETK